MPGPLDGVRVIEVASWMFVPSGGSVLADWGADVIKVEPPTGDPQRGLVTSGLLPAGTVNFMVEQPNRSKRSVAVDLTQPDGVETLMRLVATADVFLTSYLPDVRRRLGIDVDDVRARKPDIVYARGSGQGPNGPDAGKGGYDGASFWARGGIADVLVGMPYYSGIDAQRGRAILYSGSDGSVLRTFDGYDAGGRFGWSVDGLGDVNGNGGEDFLVSAYGERDPGHPRRVVGREVERRAGDVLGLAQTAERMGRERPLEQLGIGLRLARHRGAHVAGTDRVDRDPVRCELRRQRPDDLQHGPLRRVVGDARRRSHERGDGGDDDDASAVTLRP